MNGVGLHTALEILLVLINVVLVMVGAKIKADLSDMKVFMFERFVTKDTLEQRLANYRENVRQTSTSRS